MTVLFNQSGEEIRLRTPTQVIRDLRAAYPIQQGWAVVTKPITEDGFLRLEALLINPDGVIVQTANARDTAASAAEYKVLERLETAAILRLAKLVGIETGADDLDADQVRDGLRQGLRTVPQAKLQEPAEPAPSLAQSPEPQPVPQEPQPPDEAATATAAPAPAQVNETRRKAVSDHLIRVAASVARQRGEALPVFADDQAISAYIGNAAKARNGAHR